MKKRSRKAIIDTILYQRKDKKERTMKTAMNLRTMLKQIDRKGYPAYKSLAGRYDFGEYVLSIDHVQGDPF